MDQVENVQEEQSAAAEQTLSPGEENKPPETEQPSKTLLEEEEVTQKDQDETEALPKEQTTVDEQALSQGVDKQSDTLEPSQTQEDTKDSENVQAMPTPEKQTKVEDQKEEESNLVETEDLSKTPQTVEDSEKDKTKTVPEDLTTVDDQKLLQIEESKPSEELEPSQTLEITRDSQKDLDQKETVPEDQITIDEQKPSPGEENKSSETEKPSTTIEQAEDFRKDRAETEPEEQTTVDEQASSQEEENKPSIRVEQSETLEVVRDSPKPVKEVDSDVVGSKQPLPEASKQPVTEPSRTSYGVKLPEKVRDILQKPVFITATVVILIAIIWSSIRNISKVDTPDKPAERCDPRKGDCSQFLSQSIHNLAEKYKDQESNSWRTLHAAALSHVSLKPKPVRPIVILVYWVNASNPQILFDISKVYSSLLSGSKDDANITILGKDFVNQEPESVQKLIAERLEHGFKDGKKVAIIHDFDNLPSCSVLTFHNYCNNEDAPYTNVAIILTMTGNPEMEPGQKPKVLEESVSTIFHKKWSDCPDDLPPGKIDAILSRVANNVVLLR